MTSSSFVTTINPNVKEKLLKDLTAQGFSIQYPPHTLFLAKKPGITCTLYPSGKLLVQGKNRHEFLLYYLEPTILHDLSYSYPAQKQGFLSQIGVDEAGKGDFFGPLCIASFYASAEEIPSLLKLKICDSKRLSDSSVRKTALILKARFPHSLVKLLPESYNRLYEKWKNLNRLLAWGHATAIENLYNKTGCKDVIIDQFAHVSLVQKAIEAKALPISLTQRHRGEEELVVAAASILARASFLEELESLSKAYEFPFPKGASQEVIERGKQFIQRYSPKLLPKVAKVHFRTTEALFT